MQETFTLKGKRAVVTGSTSGIGLGIARALAAQGCKVMLNGFGEPEAIETLRRALEEEYGTEIAYNAADLSRAKECEALIRDAENSWGGVDILVNNAGIQHVAPVEDFPPERWDAVIAINLSSAFHTIRAALPGMKASGYGRIVNIASAHGLVASACKSAYVAAKHGVVGLTKVVALENAETGVTCNAICPGWVLTALVEKQIHARAEAENLSVEEASRHLLSEKQPSKRFTTVDELGELTVFLCGPAAGNITGASMPVDGGWTAQ
ncbi:3-hydroxybutyrate dehydrogenase [Telmatospirillum sp. J64-1]|uniref:3-hydroxybutyrate dehydrogenase n=1 Tax=Telmatospirillum sp. J64-1 TaxID=2502183 RepID=UPI00115D8DB1|nr:3-hydroxybutyrate dehydrogenase [Telmatospirillum sp. J64-1]